MRWLDKMERKFGKYAISNLMQYIVLLTGSVYLLSLFDQSGTFISRLVLVPSLVMKGQVWRLITYVFIPPNVSMLFIIFVLYLYYMIGMSLERIWGTFKFNLYYFIGILATTIVAFLTRGSATSYYLNLSIFLAFAKLNPNYEILLFFVLPVKMKYLAWFNWGLFAFTIITAPLPRKITAAVALSNYFIFFGRDIINDLRRKKKVAKNRSRFEQGKKWNQGGRDSIHRCTVCGITEKDDPEMEFRYCSQCEGTHEYCQEHIRDHEHIKE
ncbi:MAG: rhomboid family intramembrane serine protease [Halanaerobiaceae bacterium]